MNNMATNIIKESRVREIFKERQVSAEAIKCIDIWVERNIKAIYEGLNKNARITDIDIDLFINTQLLNDSTWVTARDFLIKKQLEHITEEEN
jgi:hypothetical protein